MAKRDKFGFTKTICWNCIHSVPNQADGIGCNWSIRFEPVDGWDATRTDYLYRARVDQEGVILDSYIVHNCPKFKRDIRPYDHILFDKIESFRTVEMDDDEFDERLIATLLNASLTKAELLEMRQADLDMSNNHIRTDPLERIQIRKDNEKLRQKLKKRRQRAQRKAENENVG